MPTAIMMRYILLCLFITFNRTFAFVLDKQNPYSQFKKWNAGLNGTVELEFKTDQQNGLLLYTDDGGTYDFFELKLVNGQLRLRYNLGGGAQIIAVGSNLNDGHWHKVQVARRDEHTSLAVDGDTQSKTSRGKEFVFGKFNSNSDVFVGGIPPSYNSKLTTLTLPSVIFEPKFRGAVRNLVYSDLPGQPPRRQELRHSRDLKTSRTTNASGDACERRDPCQHGGVCISTDDGPVCECRDGDYEGAFCERDKAPSEATFRGAEFLSYDLTQTGGEPIVSTQDAISLYFKTRQPNGLLFYTGHEADYLNLAVRDGGLSLTMGLGNGKQEIHIKPPKTRFDDHQWHKLTVHRKIQEVSSGAMSFCRVSAIVDDVYMEHSHVAGTFTMLASSRAHVGGSLNARALPGARVHNNFIGCLKKVEFSADTLRLNLIDLARTGSKLITVTGRLDYACTAVDHADPVTFATRDAHLVRPPTAFTPADPVKRQYRAYIGFRLVSDGSRHGTHNHRYGYHPMRLRNHNHSMRKHRVTPTVDTETMPTPKVVVIKYFVTFKPSNTTKANLTSMNLTEYQRITKDKENHAPDEKYANKETHASGVLIFTGRKGTPITEDDKDLTHLNSKDLPLRPYHSELNDDLLSRAIKISLPVTFKDPIPTPPTTIDTTQDNMDIEKTDQKLETTMKKNEKADNGVVISIIANSSQFSYTNPGERVLNYTKEMLDELIAFEKRRDASLGGQWHRAPFPKKYISAPSKKKAEIMQNSTYLIT